MPRRTIEIRQNVEYLSILAEDGTVDKALEPKLSDNDLRKLYKTMLHSRIFDERCLHLQRQGRIGTYGPSKGQEAAALGPVFAIGKEDWFVPSFRETTAMIWRGMPLEKIILWWGGNEIGSAIPEGLNDLPICVPVASQCQYGMGIAWGCKLRKDNTVCVTYCGDGGTSEGDFHEAMNFAGVYKAPLIMVVQNNQWAISIPREKQTASPTIAQKAIAYGIPGIQVDGNDILAMVVAAQEAVARARKGEGPTLIEAVTYRLAMHTTADDPKKYRTDDEVKCWEPRDPLIRFKKYLQNRKLLDDKVQAVIEEEIASSIDAAIKLYEQYQPDVYDMFRHMYAEMTPELQRQMAELKAHLENGQAAPNPAASMAH